MNSMVRSQRIRRSIILVSLGLGLIVGVAAYLMSMQPQPIRDAPMMRAALMDAIPLGTPVDGARATIEQRGFQCREVERGDWIDLVGVGTHGVVRSGIDLLRCSRRDNDFIGFTIWMVGLVREDGSVADVLVRQDLIWP